MSRLSFRPRLAWTVLVLAGAALATSIFLLVNDSASNRLVWAPPPLTTPKTITLGTGETKTTLDKTQDYVIELPATSKGATTIIGGRNVVIKGGSIKVPRESNSQRGLYIMDNTGTVHVEGVLIDNTGGPGTDGIVINSPASTVQIENVRILGITGEVSGWHGDIIQPWGGVKTLRIDHLTGHSNYQGLFLRPDLGPIGSIDIRNTDLYYDNVGARTGGYLLWLTTGCDTARSKLTDVYLGRVHPGKTLATSVWPDINSREGCALTQTSPTSVSWPSLPVNGQVKLGNPPGGVFVPAGKAGTDYKSPGYED